MLWLRDFDNLSRLPGMSVFRKFSSKVGKEAICIIRPGGLGDMVLLTRALQEEGFDLNHFTWIGEKRNTPWLDYLGIPYSDYSNPIYFLDIMRGKFKFNYVINSEQHYGLSTLFAQRLLGKQSYLVGFKTNIRSDLYDKIIIYKENNHELSNLKNLIKDIPYSKNKVPEIVTNRSNHTVIALSGLQSAKRKLTIQQWHSIVKKTLEKNENVYLVGSKQDIVFATLFKIKNNNFHNVVGKYSFKEVIDLIKTAKEFVAIDSGLVHVADYFKTPSKVIIARDKYPKWRPLLEASECFHSLDLFLKH